jgi:hypothetical protein
MFQGANAARRLDVEERIREERWRPWSEGD